MNLWARILTLCCFAATLCGSGAFAQGGDPGLPLGKLPRLQALDEARRDELLALFRTQKSHGACNTPIYDCLVQTKPEPAAVRMANFAAFLLSRGVPVQGLDKFFTQRAEFAVAERQEFDVTKAPQHGDPKAQIRLIEFGEFKCPMCGTVGPLLKKLVDESNGAVLLSFKHFPIMAHEGTMLASRAAAAAQRQGKFWEMSELLFQNRGMNEEGAVLELAGRLGLDMGRFRKDFDDPEVSKMVRSDKVEGLNAKVEYTPCIFINGKRYDLRMEEAHLKDTINEEAERLGIAPPYRDWVY
jgi:protein-disulfide isomerase